MLTERIALPLNVRKQIIALVGNSKEKTILEFGCSVGTLTMHLAEEVGPKGPLFTRLTHLVTEDYKLTTYAELPEYGDIYDRENDKSELNNLWEKDEKLRLKLLDKLFHEYMMTRSRFPIRQGGT